MPGRIALLIEIDRLQKIEDENLDAAEHFTSRAKRIRARRRQLERELKLLAEDEDDRRRTRRIVREFAPPGTRERTA